MNSEEIVPTSTPIVMIKEKAKMLDPPKRTSANSTTKVVPDVIKVLESVTFKAWFTVSHRVFRLLIFKSSRIRSKTIMVSLSE